MTYLTRGLFFSFLAIAACGGNTTTPDGGADSGDGGGGNTTIVGTWNRPGSSTMADITLMITGTTTSGPFTMAGVSKNIDSDPPCTQNSSFVGTYTATSSTLAFTGTSGTFNQTNCTNAGNDMPDTPIPAQTITNTLGSVSGNYTVSSTTLTITAGDGTVTAFTRE